MYTTFFLFILSLLGPDATDQEISQKCVEQYGVNCSSMQTMSGDVGTTPPDDKPPASGN